MSWTSFSTLSAAGCLPQSAWQRNGPNQPQRASAAARLSQATAKRGAERTCANPVRTASANCSPQQRWYPQSCLSAPLIRFNLHQLALVLWEVIKIRCFKHFKHIKAFAFCCWCGWYFFFFFSDVVKWDKDPKSLVKREAEGRLSIPAAAHAQYQGDAPA